MVREKIFHFYDGCQNYAKERIFHFCEGGQYTCGALTTTGTRKTHNSIGPSKMKTS